MNSSALEKTIILLQNALRENKETITNTLIKIESLKTIKDEFDRVESLLLNIHKQKSFILAAEVEKIAVYLPQNQPLYSLFLFGVVPSLFSHKVFIRPPILLRELYTELLKSFSTVFSNIVLVNFSRRAFFDNVTAASQVVIFTGKFSNVNSLCKRLSKETLLLYNGSSSNPFIIGKDAELSSAVKKCIRAQTYNSGQDCMAPRMIIVHDSISDQFSQLLIEAVRNLTIGEYSDEQVDIGPLLSMEAFESGVKFLQDHRSTTLCGGQIAREKRIIYPTIMHFRTLAALPTEELFAPFFRIVKYSDIGDVIAFLNSIKMRTIAGYVSYFGADPLATIPGYQIIHNDALESLDDGNEPFGGYGTQASFVKFGDYFNPQPVLVSQEVARFFGKAGYVG